MLDPPIHPDDALRAQLDPSGGIVDPRPLIAAQARKRNAVWPSRDSARAAWQDKPMFKAWQPRAFDLYLAEGFRDRPDGQVELKCRPDVEATIFATSGDLDIFAAAPRIAAPVLLVRAGRGTLPAQAFEHLRRLTASVHDARTRRRSSVATGGAGTNGATVARVRRYAGRRFNTCRWWSCFERVMR